MAELPEIRMTPFSPPFLYTSCDYFGPYSVKVGRNVWKAVGDFIHMPQTYGTRHTSATLTNHGLLFRRRVQGAIAHACYFISTRVPFSRRMLFTAHASGIDRPIRYLV